MNNAIENGLKTISTTMASKKETATFDVGDYIVFFLMLLVSVLIGVYFACTGDKQRTKSDYLLGGRKMSALPVGLSLVACQVSGIALIGIPTEVYSEGIYYFIMEPTLLLVVLSLAYLYIPVYFHLGTTSGYEYLEIRFSKSTRILASLIYLGSTTFFLPQYLYIPALIMNQVTGININYIAAVVCAICVFYTMIGGVKAVIWTDFFQTFVTIVVCFAVLTIGTIDVGGLSYVYNTALNGNKLNIFDMTLNPFQRSSFWAMIIGSYFMMSSHIAPAQGSIQRFMSVPTLWEAQKILIVYWVGHTILISLSVYAGVLLYAVYNDHDLLAKGIITRPDQMYMHYVQDKIGYIPTLPGLFVAGIFSTALSSLSSSLNSMAGTIYEDFIKKDDTSERKANIIMKALVIILGCIAVITVPLIAQMGRIITIAYGIQSIIGTPSFALFALGILVPWANTKGAITGALVGCAFTAWVAIGGILSYGQTTDDVFIMYRLSYILYVTFGFIIAMIVGVAVSFLTGGNNLKTLDPKLISPPMRRFLPRRNTYETEQAMKTLIIKGKDFYQ